MIENYKEPLLIRILRKLGIIKRYDISKAKMCKDAQSICDHDCDICAWNEMRLLDE